MTKKINRLEIPQICAECGTRFIAHRYADRFCSKTCNATDNKRTMKRGRKALQAVMLYGSSYKRRGEGLLLISQLARSWKEEDKRRRDDNTRRRKSQTNFE